MLDINDGGTKKGFFVCNSGLNTMTQLNTFDSYALAGNNHNIYVFSFVTGTCITSFYAHDDIINSVLYINVKYIYLLIFLGLVDNLLK
jgi:hypothetical protein